MITVPSIGVRPLLGKRAGLALQVLSVALLVAVAYAFSTWLGLTLHLPNFTVPLIWLPTTVILAALLSTPRKRWWIWILTVAITHVAVNTLLNVFLVRQVVTLAHDVLLALLIAGVLRRYTSGQLQVTTLRGVAVLLVTAVGVALLIPFGISIVYAAVVSPDSFWSAWWLSAFPNTLAFLTVLPAILLSIQNGPTWLRELSRPRAAEVLVFALLLLSSSLVIFRFLPADPASGVSIRFGLLPLLLWAAVRFGPGGLSLALTASCVIAMWSTTLGYGPYLQASPVQNTLNLQSEFIALAAPLMLLAALIAQQQRAERKLVELNAQLESRVAERTAQLTVAKDRAESANRAKSTFLSTISHELRTPLHTIMGYNRLNVSGPALPPAQHKNAVIVQNSAEHLLTLINSVLDLSRIEAGQTPLLTTTADIPQLLDGLVDMFRLQAESKGLYVRRLRTSDVPAYVFVDAVKLRQVLINLLGNAVKFTETGGVTLAVCCERDEPQPETDEPPTVTLVFEVTDTGPGITPDEQQQMFEAFVQTRAGQRLGEGSGLGLAISRHFVGLMGGELRVRSNAGYGTMFAVRIPVQVAQIDDIPHGETLGRATALAPEHAAYRVLVVDNHHDNRRLLTSFLGSLGLNVREARDGEEALAVGEAWQPQLIFLDLRLPRMSGGAVAKQIRETAAERPVIIALSASGFDENDTEAYAEEFDDFMRKPFQSSEIAEALHRHLGTGLRNATTSAQAAHELRTMLDMSALASLPDDRLATLERMSIAGNPQQIAAAISAIAPDNAELAAALQTMADQVAFDLILEAVRSAQKAKGSDEPA
ncbi:MAG: response regulator [Roseiflexaceae bacterium]|nr:response regulator [Roseiflexaceae bacterium]